MAYQYIEQLPSEARIRYGEKITVAKLNICPYQLPEGLWCDDPTLWPMVEYPDIYDYLINTPGK